MYWLKIICLHVITILNFLLSLKLYFHDLSAPTPPAPRTTWKPAPDPHTPHQIRGCSCPLTRKPSSAHLLPSSEGAKTCKACVTCGEIQSCLVQGNQFNYLNAIIRASCRQCDSKLFGPGGPVQLSPLLSNLYEPLQCLRHLFQLLAYFSIIIVGHQRRICTRQHKNSSPFSSRCLTA
jgi:hypothetical protein